MLRDITKPYSRVEAWAYDAFIAPAVARIGARLEDELLALVEEGGRVLDVGCGGGHIALSAARRRPDVHMTGLDLSESQVARAAKRGADLGDRVRFVAGDAQAQPFEDGAFDAVYSVASVKHWPDAARGVSECLRVLRPGGWLLIGEADRGCSDEAVHAFVAGWGVPAFLRPAAARFFRRVVAGQSLDQRDAARLVEGLALEDLTIGAVADSPAWVLRAKRPAPDALDQVRG